ncbi:MAG: hypothetical protein V1716_00280 [Candidatus Uhrbacteria bacterium]
MSNDELYEEWVRLRDKEAGLYVSRPGGASSKLKKPEETSLEAEKVSKDLAEAQGALRSFEAEHQGLIEQFQRKRTEFVDALHRDGGWG